MELSVKYATTLLVTFVSCGSAIGGWQLWLKTNSHAWNDATEFYEEERVSVHTSLQGKKYPVITAKNQRITLHSDFDVLTDVKAEDAQDGNISHNIKVYGEVDTNTHGEYILRYVVRNSFGLKSEKRIKVLVD